MLHALVQKRLNKYFLNERMVRVKFKISRLRECTKEETSVQLAGDAVEFLVLTGKNIKV